MMDTNCTSCKIGILASYGVCIDQCQSNQYILGGKCLNCSYPCAKCFRTADYCVACIKGMIVSSGKCIIDCPPKQYYDSQVISCQPCDQTCATCLNSTTCLTCADPTLTPRNGICPFCSKEECLQCGHDNRCSVCKNGLFLFNGACR